MTHRCGGTWIRGTFDPNLGMEGEGLPKSVGIHAVVIRGGPNYL